MKNFAVKSNDKELLKAFEEKLIAYGYKNRSYSYDRDKDNHIIIYNNEAYSYSTHGGLQSEKVFNLCTDWLDINKYLKINKNNMKKDDEISNLKKQIEKLNNRISQLEKEKNNNIIKVPEHIKIYKYDEDTLALGISDNRMLYVKNNKWLIDDANDLMEYKCELKEIDIDDIEVGDIIVDFNVNATENQFNKHNRYNVIINKNNFKYNKFMYETNDNKIAEIFISNYNNKFYKVVPI